MHRTDRSRISLHAILLAALAALPALLAALPASAAPFARTSEPARFDPFLYQMTSATSPDSIRAFLEKLTGEVPVTFPYGVRTIETRYSPSNGAFDASLFLQRRFQELGYDVTLDYFRFDQALRGLYIDPGGVGLMVGSGGWILRTPDGGVWTRALQGCDQLSQPLSDLCRFADGLAVAVGGGGTIVATSDAGQSWTFRSSGTSARLNGVDLTSGGVGWAVGENGACVRTLNGGASWTPQLSGTAAHLRDVCALGPGTALVVGEGGTILRTANGGAGWTLISSGITTSLHAVAPAGGNLVAVGQAGRILASTDAGLTWSPRTSPTTFDLNAVSFSGANGWAVGNTGRAIRSTDGGFTWTQQTTSMPGATFTTVRAVSDLEGWVAGGDGHLLKTLDGGLHWTTLDDSVHAGWANVIATRPGTVSPEQEVLLTSHYDSMSEIPAVRAPGADDNASGTAVVCEAARVMAPYRFEKTLRFICFSGEEEGLMGSTAYASRAISTGEQITGVFNLDCVGWSDLYLRLVTNETSQWLGSLAQALAAEYAPELPVQAIVCPLCNWSDHGPFWDQGYSALCGIEAWEPMPPQIHTVGDTLGLLDLPLLARVSRISLATVATIAVLDSTVVSAPDQPGLPFDELAAAGTVRVIPAGPDPFREGTLLRYVVPRTFPYRLALYDPAGRLVRVLRSGSGSGGIEDAFWDGRTRKGQPASPGVYFYRLETIGGSRTGKLTRVR